MNKDKEKFRIGYIDENEEDIRLFQRFSDNHFVVMVFEPDKHTKVEDIIEWVIENELQAIIIDYDLKEKRGVRFFGNELADEINKEFYNFPIFILTSYEERAIDESECGDIIYDKDLMETKGGILIKRIRNKIQEYIQLFKKTDEEYSKLFAEYNSKTGLSLKEEDRLIELDCILEKRLGNKGRLPKLAKKFQYLKEINGLNKKAEELLRKFKK